MPINTYEELNRATRVLNRIHGEIQRAKLRHPEWRVGYSREPGSLLNAYREGDLSFNDCKRLLIHVIEDGVRSRADESLCLGSHLEQEGKKL